MTLLAMSPSPSLLPAGAQISEALKAERRKTNNLERDLRTLKRQLSQFSKINPDEYERLQEARAAEGTAGT